jgi:hypothetical protein
LSRGNFRLKNIGNPSGPYGRKPEIDHLKFITMYILMIFSGELPSYIHNFLKLDNFPQSKIGNFTLYALSKILDVDQGEVSSGLTSFS